MRTMKLVPLVLVLCIAISPATAIDAFLLRQADAPGDDISSRQGDDEDEPQQAMGLPEEERRQVTLASRRPARQLKPRTASRLVLASTAREPRIAPAQAPVPDGWLLCWRRHANGRLAAIIGHPDGTMTARLWPDVDRFSTGIRNMATAQHAADTLAHADTACDGCKPWTFS
jgi:hypothetical protein